MSHKLSWGCRRIHSGAAYGHVAVRLTLSDRFYTATLIRPDNEQQERHMSFKSRLLRSVVTLAFISTLSAGSALADVVFTDLALPPSVAYDTINNLSVCGSCGSPGDFSQSVAMQFIPGGNYTMFEAFLGVVWFSGTNEVVVSLHEDASGTVGTTLFSTDTTGTTTLGGVTAAFFPCIRPTLLARSRTICHRHRHSMV
jgi:hypothetical protein